VAVGDDFRALLRREEVAAGARMPLLPAALAARAHALLLAWGLAALTGLPRSGSQRHRSMVAWRSF
jgi:hypothetical protein